MNNRTFGATMPDGDGPPLSRSPSGGGGGGGGGGFGLFTLMPLLYLGKTVLDLGGGYQAWTPALVAANFGQLPLPQKAIMAFMALRVAGLSPF